MSETKTVWHPYPDEKPPRKNTTYLVTQKSQWEETGIRVTTARWNVRTWQAVDVIAWAELPEPYKENT